MAVGPFRAARRTAAGCSAREQVVMDRVSISASRQANSFFIFINTFLSFVSERKIL